MSSGSHGQRHVRTFPVDGVAESIVRKWTTDGGILVAPEEDFRGVDFSGIDISECWLTGTDLSNVSFAGADLSYGHLARAVLRGAHFGNVRMVDADLCGADLADAVFVRGDLIKSTFAGSSMSGCSFVACDLGSANLDNVDLRGVRLSDSRVNNTGFDVWLDDSTQVDGLHGSVYGPAFVTDCYGSRELAGMELGEWLRARGAEVEVRTSVAGRSRFWWKRSNSAEGDRL